MARSHKKAPRSSFVVIPLGPDHSRSSASGRLTNLATGTKAPAVELVLRLRFTIDVQVETEDERDAI